MKRTTLLLLLLFATASILLFAADRGNARGGQGNAAKGRGALQGGGT